MNKLGLLIVILILNISVGCASLWGIKSGAESMNTKIKGANAEVIQKEVFQAVSVTMASKMDSLQSGSSSESDDSISDMTSEILSRQISKIVS